MSSIVSVSHFSCTCSTTHRSAILEPLCLHHQEKRMHNNNKALSSSTSLWLPVSIYPHDHLVRHSERLFLIFQLREERQRRSAEECRSHSSMWGTHTFLHLLGVSLGNTDSGGPTCEPWKPPCGRLLRGQPQTHPVMNGGAPEFPKIPCALLGWLYRLYSIVILVLIFLLFNSFNSAAGLYKIVDVKCGPI